MQTLSLSEKKENLGGAYSRIRGARHASSAILYNKKIGGYNARLHNFSLLTLATIPGLITLGEELYQLLSSRKRVLPAKLGYGGSFAGSEYHPSFNNINNRRDFFAYASEAFRPSIRFSPYYYKSGITFGMPWFK